MSKYQPLADRLSSHDGHEWQASFAEIEEVLGFPLPKSAREQRAWWANESQTEKPHKRAWLEHGWRTEDVDQASGRVTFRRSEISPIAVEAAAGLEPLEPTPDTDLDMPPPPPAPNALSHAQPALQAGASQATDLREAAEEASRLWRRQRALRGAALVGSGIAIAAAVALMLLRRARLLR